MSVLPWDEDLEDGKAASESANDERSVVRDLEGRHALVLEDAAAEALGGLPMRLIACLLVDGWLSL